MRPFTCVRSCRTIDEFRQCSLMQLHNELARLETMIVEGLSERSDAAECLRVWETINDPSQVRWTCEIDRALRYRYAAIAEVCQEKERKEIAALRAEAKQPSCSELVATWARLEGWV